MRTVEAEEQAAAARSEAQSLRVQVAIESGRPEQMIAMALARSKKKGIGLFHERREDKMR